MEAEVYHDWINATLRAVSAEDEIEVHVQAANDMRDVALQFQAERDRYRAAWLNARSRAKHADAVTGLAIERAERAEQELRGTNLEIQQYKRTVESYAATLDRVRELLDLHDPCIGSSDGSCGVIQDIRNALDGEMSDD